jgi:hypothetical protein
MLWSALRKLNSSSESHRLDAIRELGASTDAKALTALIGCLRMWDSAVVRNAAAEALLRAADTAPRQANGVLADAVTSALAVEGDERVARSELQLLYLHGFFASKAAEGLSDVLLDKAERFGEARIRDIAKQVRMTREARAGKQRRERETLGKEAAERDAPRRNAIKLIAEELGDSAADSLSALLSSAHPSEVINSLLQLGRPAAARVLTVAFDLNPRSVLADYLYGLGVQEPYSRLAGERRAQEAADEAERSAAEERSYGDYFPVEMNVVVLSEAKKGAGPGKAEELERALERLPIVEVLPAKRFLAKAVEDRGFSDARSIKEVIMRAAIETSYNQGNFGELCGSAAVVGSPLPHLRASHSWQSAHDAFGTKTFYAVRVGPSRYLCGDQTYYG